MFFVIQIPIEQIAVLIQIRNRIRRLQRIRNVLFISPALRPALEDSVAGSKNAGSCQTDNQSDDQPFDRRLSVSSVFPFSVVSAFTASVTCSILTPLRPFSSACRNALFSTAVFIVCRSYILHPILLSDTWDFADRSRFFHGCSAHVP